MILTADTAGERLDAFLARSLPDMSRSAAQKLVEGGHVTVMLPSKAGQKNQSWRQFLFVRSWSGWAFLR